jgi:hypothetical protein
MGNGAKVTMGGHAVTTAARKTAMMTTMMTTLGTTAMVSS